MLELADRLLPLLARGTRIAVATCIDVLGSAPHGAGTSMAVGADGTVAGAVSGGCVEAAALADCRAVLAGGPAVVRRYGFGDAAGARAGLSCGGEIDVLTCLIDPGAAGTGAVVEQLERRMRGEPAAVAFVTGGAVPALGLPLTPSRIPPVPGAPERAARAVLEGALQGGRPGGAEIACTGTPVRLFVDVAARAPRLLVIGATETAAALVAAAAAIGLVVTVCDPRADFALRARFPAAHDVVVARPHEVLTGFAPTAADAVCLLSHDDDLDAMALAVALESDAGYVGALGSRSTAARRRDRLTALGLSPDLVDRLRSPIGLDLGARTPGETAVSILAELLAVRAGATAAPLRSGAGPIHRPIPMTA